MSRKEKKPGHLGSKKAERYIQASILISLKIKPSYGYELIQEISRFGFIEGQVAPGMIYRHLRELEENGLVFSEWETDGTGPAKRVYQLTMEGMEVLGYWIEYMTKQADNLSRFVEMYQEIIKKGK